MDQELDEFFGEVKVKQEGNAHKRRRPEESRNTFGPKDRDKDQGPKEKREDSLLVSLARLALKQEEELLVLKQDFSLILFLKAGSNSVLPFLYQAATLYKAKQKESPTWSVNFQPPRTVLALAMIKELATRLDAVTADKARYKEVQDMGWMDQQGAWKFHLQADTERAPLTAQQIKELLEELYKSLKGDVVTRFRCTRKLTETMESQATFYFDISTRGQGQDAWKILMMLQGNCVLQLIGLGFKKAGLRRGPIAEKVRDWLTRR